MARRSTFALFLFSVFLLPTVSFADDWPHFLGPKQDLHTAEKGLNLVFPKEGPKLLWAYERGKGHAGPVIVDDHVVFIQEVKGQEEIICLNAKDGKEIWKHGYEIKVSQNFGITDAPRSSPIIDPATKTVYTLGNDGDLISLELKTGKVLWQKNLTETFGEAPFFFGQGSCPLLYKDKLIVHVGRNDACVVAFNPGNGEVIWKTPHEWNGSYASPVVGKVNGQDRLFVFAGGMTKPPHGGLISMNPEDGKIDDSIEWRSDMFASVNAASPVPCGENRVFITEDYGKGGVMIQFDQNFKASYAWEAEDLGCQFQTPVYHEGHLYGFGASGGLLVCYDAVYGRLRWSNAFLRVTVPWKGRDLPINMGKGSMIYVDGAFLLLGENGTMVRADLSPNGMSMMAIAQTFYTPETWAPPAISNGRLFICQNEVQVDGTKTSPRKLYCYDIGGGGR